MNSKFIKSVFKEYGAKWVVDRCLYGGKLKLISIVKGTDRLFEKKVGYPFRLDIFELNTNRISDFLRAIPPEKKDILVKMADNICEGKIYGFGSILLDYGDPIDWQLNPLTGKKCDGKLKWYDIPDFNQKRGDIKIVWEASRFSHFLTLSRAYLLTGDQKYYRAFSSQLDDWINKNPYSFGANFKCGQECSLRMINGLLTYTVFYSCGLSTTVDKGNIETLILRCYRKILSNFFYARKCIKNNHTISELMGMIVGSWCCGENERLSYAFRTLDEVIDEQFAGDGGYEQHSFNYQRLALQDLEVVLCIEDKVGHKLNEKSKKKILAAANLMYQCQDESGDMPNYGSNDGALVFPVTSCGYRDFRSVINTISVFIAGDRMYEKGLYDEELLWFGKEKGVLVKTKRRKSKAFDEAGLYTIRNDHSWMMVVLNVYQSRPAHMDQLHIDLWVNGINVLCDGGTFSYANELGRKLVGNESHNTIMAGESQMNAYGPFMIYDWTKRTRVRAEKNFFVGEYISQNGYKHRRRIKAIETGYEIDDVVDCDYKVLFHTPCEVRVQGNKVMLYEDGIWIGSIFSDGDISFLGTKRSLYYLRAEDIVCIVIEGRANSKMKTTIQLIGENR